MIETINSLQANLKSNNRRLSPKPLDKDISNANKIETLYMLYVIFFSISGYALLDITKVKKKDKPWKYSPLPITRKRRTEGNRV